MKGGEHTPAAAPATIADRGITVGKSWPRPATPCDLVPRWEGEFCSHGDWVNFASKRLTVATDSNGSQLTAICVDSIGRRCANGRDMARARDEGTFPVRYFWDCEPRTPDSSQANPIEALSSRVEAAIAEHEEWARKALPSKNPQPRVMVTDGHATVSRRPFKSGGHWRVRWAGTARLTDPHVIDGWTVFTADWGRP